MKEQRSDELIEIANGGRPLNKYWTVTYVRVAIFRCGIKGQEFKVCEFAILIIISIFLLRFFGFHVNLERFFGF